MKWEQEVLAVAVQIGKDSTRSMIQVAEAVKRAGKSSREAYLAAQLVTREPNEQELERMFAGAVSKADVMHRSVVFQNQKAGIVRLAVMQVFDRPIRSGPVSPRRVPHAQRRPH